VWSKRWLQQEEDIGRDDIDTIERSRMMRRMRMQRELGRIAVLLSIVALLFAACGSQQATSAPSAVASASAPAGSGEPSASATPAPTPLPVTGSEAKPGDVVIRWYCCLGTGDSPDLVEAELKAADEFNASHPGIHLQFEGFIFDLARDSLAVMIGSGNGPDVVGPVGIGGAEAFHGQWLDLQPLIDKNKFDMSQFPQSTINLYNAGGEGQVGIPYAIYPSVLFYKASMFKEAGLAEPPHEWNSTYTMPDGKKVPWDYDTVREIAKILTVDKNGKDATEEGFDPENIVQWGFEPQRDDMRQTGAYWGAGSFMAADGKTVQMPEPWVAAWKHFYNGIWTDHFSVTGPQFQNTDLYPSGYPFHTGHVAMSTNYIWSLYGLKDAAKTFTDWNMAATPAYKGKTTAAFNADTFRILKSSKNPDAAFEVLKFLLSNKDLISAYAAMPAVEAEQDAFLQGLQADYSQTVDWNVAKQGVPFADVPNFESFVPAYNQTFDLIQAFYTKWQATPGLDLDKEIADLKTQMQAKWDAGGS
jgi:multiple sugar transport system substrate-binding protein